MILPANMDGVPGLSFGGIAPGETFTYRFDVRQSGTYWYHSHSRFQEQIGLYGPIVIEPRDGEPVLLKRRRHRGADAGCGSGDDRGAGHGASVPNRCAMGSSMRWRTLR